jgi:hypothetical protein
MNAIELPIYFFLLLLVVHLIEWPVFKYFEIKERREKECKRKKK